ncbi:DUF3363 domain-containing protein [Hellea balneolensis]|uniref:DUF3363 domain-containing protein n=1 Tax=Hellea balneolensis TaxID=287478 RepID=UPI00040996F9|nr:DUF3363 domain-containing protein [Hellea balneolensis]
MKAIRRLDQYLRLRGDTWHYVRRVPKAVRHIDDRTVIYRSLDTDSRKIARQRRDICADEDNQRWNEITPSRFQSSSKHASYRDASHRARSQGFNYKPMESLVSQNTVTNLLHRLIALEPLKDSPQRKEELDAVALLGSVKTPSATITEAMDLYLSEIVADELAGKSPEQIQNFSKIKRRAVSNFVNLNGDIDMRCITREHAHTVRKFWHERIHPKDGSKPMSGSRSAAYMRAHRLRLATLAKAAVVQVASKDKDGNPLEWRVPEDFEERAISLDLKQGRASGVKLLSRQDLNAQLESPGATWLDRAQVSWGRGGLGGISVKSSAFAKELDTAFQQRRTWLIERGYAELRQDEQKTSIIYKRGYLKALETEGFNAATEKLESMTGKAHVAAQSGRLIEGTVSQKYELPHGPHAMIETQRAFYLVPWESTHAQKWGKRIKGRVLSGGGIDWDAGRSRGIGR